MGFYPLVNIQKTMGKITIFKNGTSTISMGHFNSYVKLPEGKWHRYVPAIFTEKHSKFVTFPSHFSTAWVGSSHRWPDGPITSAPGCMPTHLDGSNEGFGAHQLLKADGDHADDGDGSSHDWWWVHWVARKWLLFGREMNTQAMDRLYGIHDRTIELRILWICIFNCVYI